MGRGVILQQLRFSFRFVCGVCDLQFRDSPFKDRRLKVRERERDGGREEKEEAFL